MPKANCREHPIQGNSSPGPRPKQAQTFPETATAPLHPSYVAALASGTVTATDTKQASGSAPPKTLVLPPAVGASWLDARVQAWESRYSAMTNESLLAAQEHLMEWQEDLSTRLMAMNKIILERLREGVGQGAAR